MLAASVTIVRSVLIEFLIATTDRKDLSFLEKIFKNLRSNDYAVLVINQCINIPVAEIQCNASNIRCISLKQGGLSRSRNEAIRNSVGDICVICDDDIILEPDTIQTIRDAYSLIESDIITFKTITPDRSPYKTYPGKNKQIKSGLDLMQISSIEISFKREEILKKSILFNEKLGLGTDATGGEEVCFLHDCLLNKLSIHFYDQFIVEHPKASSGKNYADESNAKSNGAIFKKLFPRSFILWIIYFSIKRWPVYRHKHSLIAYIKFMLEGSRIITKPYEQSG